VDFFVTSHTFKSLGSYWYTLLHQSLGILTPEVDPRVPMSDSRLRHLPVWGFHRTLGSILFNFIVILYTCSLSSLVVLTCSNLWSEIM